MIFFEFVLGDKFDNITKSKIINRSVAHPALATAIAGLSETTYLAAVPPGAPAKNGSPTS
jgi:hypothetical protein